MRNTLHLLIFVLIATSASAQQYSWSGKIGGTASASGLSTYMDAVGNSYIVGGGQGTYDLDPGPGVANVTVPVATGNFIAKLSPSGSYIWGTALPATITEVVVAPDNSIYLMGRFSDTQDMNPGAGVSNLTSAGGQDGYVLKLNAAGAFQWVARLGGAGNDCVMEAVLASDGDLIVTGFFEGSVDFDPGPGTAFLGASGSGAYRWRLTPSGAFVNASTFGAGSLGGGTAQGWAIRSDAANNVYVAGYFRGTVLLDPPAGGSITSTSPGVDDVFVAKFTAGSLSWVRTFTGIQFSSYIYSDPLDVDPAGNVVLGGRFSGTADLDPGPGTNSVTSAGGTDIFLLKLNTNGDHLWGHRIGGANDDQIVSVGTDDSGRAYATGLFRGTVDFDPGAADLVLSSSMIGGFALALSSTGAFDWAGAFTTSLNTFGTGLSTTPTGEITLCGNFNGTIDADPGPGNVPLTSSGNGEVYIIRLNNISTGLVEAAGPSEAFQLFPNPATDRITLRSGQDLYGAVITVFETTGRAVFQERITGPEVVIEMGALPDGTYILQVINREHVRTSQRFVVQH
jgi:hypothetical protein